jgi:hypothetical protein
MPALTLAALSFGITHGLRIVMRMGSIYARRNPVGLFYLLYFTLLLAFLILFLIFFCRT